MQSNKREKHVTTCYECGREAIVPFKPDGRPVYCKGCYSSRKQRVASREMYTAYCDFCANDFQVPFKPDPNRPIYCAKHRDPTTRLFEVECSNADCTNVMKLRFLPDPNRPYYCQRCYQRHQVEREMEEFRDRLEAEAPAFRRQGEQAVRHLNKIYGSPGPVHTNRKKS